jgi:hypothetical protein
MYHGIISMENFTISEIESRNTNLKKGFEGDITRSLEMALYIKFMKYNLIPPVLNEIVQLRDKNKLCEVGILNFVNKEGTSTLCPKCCKKFENYKENKGRGCCQCSCGFDTEKDSSLNTVDKVAAFNIAKRGLKNFNEYLNKWKIIS